MTDNLTYGTVCSGIEAPSCAVDPLGWKPLWFSEIEPFPKAVLAHRHPGVPDLGDMTTLPARILAGEVPAPDVFIGGTPCQSFSVAGLRKGLADPRGQLTRTFVEILDAIDTVRLARGEPPCVALWENVPGVLSDKDNAFGNFLAALVGEDEPLLPAGPKWTNAGSVLGPGRSLAWRVLDAQYFGVAQRRRRVFVVVSARAGGVDPVEVLLVEPGVRRDTPPSREAWQGPSAPAARGAASGGGERGAGDDGGRERGVMEDVAQPLRSNPYNNSDPLMEARMHIVESVVAPPLTATNDPSRSPQSSEVTQQVEAVLRATYANAGHFGTMREVFVPAISPCLETQVGGLRQPCTQAYVVTPPLTASMATPLGNGGKDAFIAIVRNTPMLAQSAVPYDLFQITAPINRQNRDERSPCHTLARDNAAHAAVVQPIAFSAKDYGGDASVDVSPTLRAGGHAASHENGGVGPAIAFDARQTDVCVTGDRTHAPAIHFDVYNHKTTGDVCGIVREQHGTNMNAVLQPSMSVRRLTPTECERLQGFPDGWTAIPWKGRPVSECPDGPRYRALGNSMAVPVIAWIARKIAGARG